jgi:hypothetical protein
MKKINFLRTIASIAIFAVAGMGAFAQVVVSNTQLTTRPAYVYSPFATLNYDNSSAETVSVGAEMPYFVQRDANVNGSFFNQSSFTWTWTGGVTKVVELRNTGVALTSGLLDTSNFVVATMPATTGPVTINAREHSNPKSGTGCDDATGTTVNVTVVALPAFSLTSGSTGGCSSTAQNLALTMTGTAPFYVDYEISAVGIDGATVVGTTKTYNATLSAASTLLIDPTQLQDVSGSATAAVPASAGKYTVKVTKVWDANSWKAMNASSLAVVPTVNTYDIYVYPTPTTAPIQHIKTL